MAIIHMVGVDRMCSIMAVDNEEIALATCNLFQCVNDSLTGGDKREYGKEEALVLGETHRQILVFYILYSERLHSNYFFLIAYLLLVYQSYSIKILLSLQIHPKT